MCKTINLVTKKTNYGTKFDHFGQNRTTTVHLLFIRQRYGNLTSISDYRNEYRKTKNNISASRAREDLLGSVQRDIDEYKGLRGGKQEMYAREREHLINSDRLADQAIEIARNALSHCSWKGYFPICRTFERMRIEAF